MKKPWYWEARRGWYVDTESGKRIRLAANKREAEIAWRHLLSSPSHSLPKDPPSRRIVEAVTQMVTRHLVRESVDLFLDEAARRMLPRTLAWYSRHLANLAALVPEVSDVTIPRVEAIVTRKLVPRPG